MRVRSAFHPGRRQAGFSLAEVLTTVAVIGILSGIMIKAYKNVGRQSSDIIANELVEAVNLGVKKFSQGNYLIEQAVEEDSAADEQAILALLQTRDVTVPGTPFVRPNWAPIASSSTEDYRIHWAGRMFDLLEPGVEGFGLKVDFHAGDYN